MFLPEKAVLVEFAFVLVHEGNFLSHYLFIILADQSNQEVKKHDENEELM